MAPPAFSLMKVLFARTMSIPAGPGGTRQAVSGLQVRRRNTGEVHPAEVRPVDVRPVQVLPVEVHIDEHPYVSRGDLNAPSQRWITTHDPHLTHR